MSHASLLVITDEKPSEQALAPLLQPWHEFECTGDDDQYVQDIDKTEEYRKNWLEHTSTMVRVEDGLLVDAYEDRFYRDPTPEETATIRPSGMGFGHGVSWASKDWGDGRGYRAKIRYVPEGCNEVKVPTAQLETFSQFIESWDGLKPVKRGEKPDFAEEHKYGYMLLGPDGNVLKAVRRTNPNKKWDWWTIGGRYSSRLIPKGNPSARLDICRRGDLDLDAMKEYQVAKRQEWAQGCVKKAEATMADLDIACRVKHHIDAAWQALPEPRPRGQEFHAWVEAGGGDWPIYAKLSRPNWELPEPAPNQSVFDWIEAAPPLTAWAVMMDNQWFEKGKMGWWGMSSDDKANWEDHFSDLFALICEDQWLAVVDYHI